MNLIDKISYKLRSKSINIRKEMKVVFILKSLKKMENMMKTNNKRIKKEMSMLFTRDLLQKLENIINANFATNFK